VSEQEPDDPYEVVVAPAAPRAISEVLPEGAAWAVIDFINGRLLTNPHRIGYPLHGRLAGLYGAHVGDYRVEYDIDDEDRRIEVVRVAHRAWPEQQRRPGVAADGHDLATTPGRRCCRPPAGAGVIREALAFGKAVYDRRVALGVSVADLALRRVDMIADEIERIEEGGTAAADLLL
jgi:mRNA interferase RelE/StbE